MRIKEEALANRSPLGVEAARELLAGADRVVVAKGRKVTRYDLHETGRDDPRLLQAMLGPTGNLRAPTLRRGRLVLVGFNQEAYEEAF